jgi:queuine tRNA-ribosyltransferase
MFQVIKKDEETRARYGVLKTAHGFIETPAYTVVGTHAEVRCLRPEDLLPTKTQVIISNTYHLWRTLGDKIDSFEGLHERMKWPYSIMTDSGGFQVFSLGFAREHGVGKVVNVFPAGMAKFDHLPGRDRNMVRITEEGVYFMEDGREIYLDAKKSIGIQEKLGADIVLAFDECTSPLHDHAYTAAAMERTHRWAEVCIKTRSRKDQLLYGIVQGGIFRDLREASGRFVGGLPFDGFAIGGAFGTSFGSGSKSETFNALNWVTPFLPEDRPRHLLGIGRIDDLFESVERGIDTFDCVIPTREARHGSLWTSHGRLDLKKGVHRSSWRPVEPGCLCHACFELGLKIGDFHRLFKEKDGGVARLATIHNVHFFNNLMTEIRKSILEDRFIRFKKKFLGKLNRGRTSLLLR